ncbi:MAG TPA: phosphopantetheine-binding protein, partial [Planctomycetia bacterium]|nr:phosphopantetheine-binding protein [Planctomycetia bacterium]
LNLEMQLDADLGIDSIKRVEILAALQEQLPDAPTIGSDQAGALRTLGDIVAFLGGDSTAANGTPSAATSAKNLAATAPKAGIDAAPILLEVVAEKTGYPPEMLNLEMQLDADLGIDSIKRVEILAALQERLPGAAAIGSEQAGALRTLGDIVTLLGGGPASAPSPRADAPAKTPEKDRLKPELQPETIERPVVAYVPRLVRLADDSPRRIALPRGAEIWIADDGSDVGTEIAARMAAEGLTPRVGSVNELTALEMPSALGGLLLVGSSTDRPTAAYVEILRLLQRCGPSLRQSAQYGAGLLAALLRFDGGFGFAGAGVSPHAAFSAGIAGFVKTAKQEWPELTCRCLDVAPEIAPAHAADAVVAELLREGPIEVGVAPGGRFAVQLAAPAAGARLSTPLLSAGDVTVITGGARGVTAEVAVALAREFRPNILLWGRSPAPGPEPEWLASAPDEAAIKRAALAARPNLSPKELQEEAKRALAAREITRTLERIAAALDALDDDLRMLAFFSSTTARLGRKGQVDYAAANEVLNKLAQREARRRPNCRTASFNWGPWDGGMVNAGLKRMFAAEKIETISLGAGARFLVDWMKSDRHDVEVCVLGEGSEIPGVAAKP